MIGILLAAALASAPSAISHGPCGSPPPPKLGRDPGGVPVHITERQVVRSPSCRWRITLRMTPGDPDETDILSIERNIPGAARRDLFTLDNTVYLHWAAGERFLVLDDVSIAGVRVFDLTKDGWRSRDLQRLVERDIRRRFQHGRASVWPHTRVRRLTADRLSLAADIMVVPNGYGSGEGHCILYDDLPLGRPFHLKGREVDYKVINGDEQPCGA